MVNGVTVGDCRQHRRQRLLSPRILLRKQIKLRTIMIYILLSIYMINSTIFYAAKLNVSDQLVVSTPLEVSPLASGT